MAARSRALVLPLALVLALALVVASWLPSAFVAGAPRAHTRTQHTQLGVWATTGEPHFTYGEFPHMYDNPYGYGWFQGPIRGDVYAKYANWKESDAVTWDKVQTVLADGTPMDKAGNRAVREVN
eukprot:CAMPEP_0171093994 /NCGR_PEP_ID=MMETSP0766_2-20121228/39472_1 /TAXON_ID=439317 /ORGANISM="Gambierdiscus australes, Strain CAWD 149" /LENGTH=123 /DNA_ID=CAMNT_0011552515 /DNA_START=72 /DNA_END=443 /DNA_ORIENTATION=+